MYPCNSNASSLRRYQDFIAIIIGKRKDDFKTSKRKEGKEEVKKFSWKLKIGITSQKKGGDEVRDYVVIMPAL